MEDSSISERRLIISNSTKNNDELPYLKVKQLNQKIFLHRVNLIKTLKIYIKKYCNHASNKYNILYLSIIYLDIILSKNKISLSYEKNLKYLCLCCFLIALKFIGNFDASKKIIKNFCHNYKDEYRIFEIQCLILLEHNIKYSTAYDYLNMILMKEQKKLLSISSSLLYKICEDNAFMYYSPFYISIAIVQIAKNSINDMTYNHYDKYFHDQRVKQLYKIFNYFINAPPVQHPIATDNIKYKYKTNYDNQFNNSNNFNNIIDNNIYTHDRNNTNSSNINIITNNNIQNNIVIINDYSKKNIDNTIDYNNNDINISRRTYYTTKNKTPIKLIINRQNNNNIEEFDSFNDKIKTFDNNMRYNNNNKERETVKCYKYKINNISKSSALSKSSFNNKEENINYTNNTFKIIRKIKQYKNIKPNYQISYCPLSSNNLNNYFFEDNIKNDCYKIINDIKMSNNNQYKNDNISNDNKSETHINNNKDSKPICQN